MRECDIKRAFDEDYRKGKNDGCSDGYANMKEALVPVST